MSVCYYCIPPCVEGNPLPQFTIDTAPRRPKITKKKIISKRSNQLLHKSRSALPSSSRCDMTDYSVVWIGYGYSTRSMSDRLYTSIHPQLLWGPWLEIIYHFIVQSANWGLWVKRGYIQKFITGRIGSIHMGKVRHWVCGCVWMGGGVEGGEGWWVVRRVMRVNRALC